ncbi:HlyD family efflux transporter periplasmic adaptor subunit [bacterium]|nr:MAG: HlyD family efflux transporter periplasmic adaptor subunit [bacterium]
MRWRGGRGAARSGDATAGCGAGGCRGTFYRKRRVEAGGSSDADTVMCAWFSLRTHPFPHQEYLSMGALVRGARRLAGAAALAVLAGCASTSSHTYSGTLQSVSATVGSTVGGRVTAVAVADGDLVQRGDVIVRFDATAQRADLLTAQGRLAQAQAALAQLRNGSRPSDVQHAAAQAAQAQALYEKTQRSGLHAIATDQVRVHEASADVAGSRSLYEQRSRDDARQRELYAHGAISAQARDASAAALSSAGAALAAARARLAAARVALDDDRAVNVPRGTAAALESYRAARAQLRTLQEGARPEEIAQARAAVEMARGSVAAARQRLDETVVRAPAEGVISALDLHAGDLVGAGMGVATVDESGNPFVRIYVPQRELAALRVGAKVDVRAEGLGGQVFQGVVEQIDQQAQFTPQNVQTAEDRANLTFGVKVRVHDSRHLLRGGTTAEVAVP